MNYVTTIDIKTPKTKLKLFSLDSISINRRFETTVIDTFGSPVKYGVGISTWDDVEIKIVSNQAEQIALSAIVTDCEPCQIKVQGAMTCDLVGYFIKMDMLMNHMTYVGLTEATLTFRVQEASGMYMVDPFEAAMCNARSTTDAIDAALNQG